MGMYPEASTDSKARRAFRLRHRARQVLSAQEARQVKVGAKAEVWLAPLPVNLIVYTELLVPEPDVFAQLLFWRHRLPIQGKLKRPHQA